MFKEFLEKHNFKILVARIYVENNVMNFKEYFLFNISDGIIKERHEFKEDEVLEPIAYENMKDGYYILYANSDKHECHEVSENMTLTNYISRNPKGLPNEKRAYEYYKKYITGIFVNNIKKLLIDSNLVEVYISIFIKEKDRTLDFVFKDSMGIIIREDKYNREIETIVESHIINIKEGWRTLSKDYIGGKFLYLIDKNNRVEHSSELIKSCRSDIYKMIKEGEVVNV